MKSSYRIVVLFAVSALLLCVAGCKSQPKNTAYTGLMCGRGNVPPAYDKIGPTQKKSAALPATPAIGDTESSVVAGPTDAPAEIGDVSIDVVEEAESTAIGGDEADVANPAPEASATGLRTLPPVPETPAIPAGEIYTVKNGDILSKIAVAYGVKTADIMALNPSITSPDKIRVGQKITLPAGAKLKASAKTSGSKGGSSKKIAKESIPADGKYSVRSGDCLDTIAKRFGVKIDDIRRWSNLSSDKLQVGQELMLKGTAAPAAAPAEPVATVPVVADVPVDGVDGVADAAAVTQPVVTDPAVTDSTPQGNAFEVGISAGDTLDSLASFYDTTKEAILKANPQIQSDADLKPGMQIIIFLNQQ